MPAPDLVKELASRLHYATPTSVKVLARDLRTSPLKLRAAAEELIGYGVLVYESDGEMTIDRDTYARAEQLAESYDDPAPVAWTRPMGRPRTRRVA